MFYDRVHLYALGSFDAFFGTLLTGVLLWPWI